MPAIASVAARAWYRVHHERYSSVEFNPGFGRGRFHPLHTSTGSTIPTLYAASTVECALAEAVLRELHSKDSLYAAQLASLRVSTIETQALRLIDLRGPALRRLGLKRLELLDSPSDRYELTGRWAVALYQWCPDADGLLWVSRQDDRAQAVLLFGDRAGAKVHSTSGAGEPLDHGAGLERVRALTTLSGICLVEG